MSYSPRQWRAIKLWLETNNLRPELSVFPVVRATNKATGEIIELHISGIEDLYTGHKERQKREAREAKKATKAKSRN